MVTKIKYPQNHSEIELTGIGAVFPITLVVFIGWTPPPMTVCRSAIMAPGTKIKKRKDAFWNENTSECLIIFTQCHLSNRELKVKIDGRLKYHREVF
jgi:hypothetical protein